MSEPARKAPRGFDQLSVDQQIDYVQWLWDRIATAAETLPPADWQRELLEERIQSHVDAPDDSIPWEEARARLTTRLREQSE